MTGSGTSADPYVVDNWNDFETAIGTSGAYVECAENLVFDMNEIYPNGVESTIQWKAKETHGNGLIIKNLFCQGAFNAIYITQGISIYEIDFLNCCYEGTYALFGGATSNTMSYFYGCKFTGIIFSSGKLFDMCAATFSPLPEVENSGNLICFKFYDNARFNASGYRTVHNFTLFAFQGNTSITTTTANSAITCNNCIFYESIPFPLRITGQYTVLDSDIAENSTITVTTEMVTSFYNSEKNSGTVTGQGGLYPISTAQLADADYLESQGFPIGVED